MNGIFWIQGRAGSGKSTLMKYIIREKKTKQLLQNDGPHSWTLVSFFFHDRGSQIQKSIKGLLKDILYSLVDTNRSLSEFALTDSLRIQAKTQALGATFARGSFASEEAAAGLTPLYDRKSFPDIESWSIKSLQEATSGIMSQTKIKMNVLFFIDALDEHSGEHNDLLNVIRRCFLLETPPNVHIKFCLASRPEPIFRVAFESCPSLSIDEHTTEDIKRYIHGQVDFSPAREDAEHNVGKLHELATEIADKANGMFIWVRIVVEELIERLVDGYTIDHLRNILSGIPEELQGFYRRVLLRIKPQYALESYILFQVFKAKPMAQKSQRVFGVIDVAMHGKYESMPRAVGLRRLASRSGGLLLEVGEDGRMEYLHQTVKSFFERSENMALMFRKWGSSSPQRRHGILTGIFHSCC